RLERQQAAFLQLLDRFAREALVGQVGQRARAPEIERLAEDIARLRHIAPGSRRASQLEKRLEPLEIKLTGLDTNQIAGGVALDPLTTERSTQAGNVIVERVRGAPRGRLAPQPVDQPIARNRPVGIQPKDRKDCAPLRAAEAEVTTVHPRPEPPEGPALH